MRPRVRGVVALAAGALLTFSITSAAFAAPNAGASAASVESMSILRPRGAGIHAASTSPLLYGGGPVETTTTTTPKVYIDYWGSQWSTGFSKGGYTSGQAQTYIQGFFGNVGGSSWNKIDTQYCMGTTVGSSTCSSGSTFITNPTSQLAATYVHNVSLPSRISQSAIASEAVWAMNNVFGGYDPNATYFVFTPSGHSMRGFGTQWCAWHSVTTSGGNQVAYAYMPYQPDAGTSCGQNFVNKTNTSYGNGYFDGFSIVGGHEYAEAQTDPHPSSGNVGWQDSSGSENGDKCAWSSSSTNISLGGNLYAVQPIWSNANSGCVTSY